MNETIKNIIENAVNEAINNGLLVVQDIEDKNAAINDFYDVIKENINIMIENDINKYSHLLYITNNDFNSIYDNIDSFTKSIIFKRMLNSIYEYYFC